VPIFIFCFTRVVVYNVKSFIVVNTLFGGNGEDCRGCYKTGDFIAFGYFPVVLVGSGLGSFVSEGIFVAVEVLGKGFIRGARLG
jgi:hypothetical protein